MAQFYDRSTYFHSFLLCIWPFVAVSGRSVEWRLFFFSCIWRGNTCQNVSQFSAHKMANWWERREKCAVQYCYHQRASGWTDKWQTGRTKICIMVCSLPFDAAVFAFFVPQRTLWHVIWPSIYVFGILSMCFATHVRHISNRLRTHATLNMLTCWPIPEHRLSPFCVHFRTAFYYILSTPKIQFGSILAILYMLLVDKNAHQKVRTLLLSALP